ncbi:signal transduction histidine kinase [Saccharomonospora marina XMU15]|uniref:histidine kinase n=1 Tax=Saccharomonospora marina XMU15 TaxID=882083 RepID=H5X9P9_9PSEU|nr:histidine kinase [Saccharomonospora marina]EHR51487.1 signal transduction histidine kinase [Saccharomonospora marina XMU15]
MWRRLLGSVVSRTTYRRWTYLILGGALLVPYALFGAVLLPSVVPLAATLPGALAIGGTAALVVLVATSFLPAVRVLEGTAVRELLADPVPEATFGTTTSWAVRARSSVLFVGHVLVGAVVSLASLLLPSVLALSLTAPFTGTFPFGGERGISVPRGWSGAWLPAVALLATLSLFGIVNGAGALLTRAAKSLLSLPVAERIAQLERRADRLAQRNRLARELHDSVGHALSVVSLQAGAARRMLSTDPAGARQALLAVEDRARAALADLDSVLGLLREDEPESRPAAGLAELPALVSATRLAGVAVDCEVDGDPAAVPPVVSRESYRILQECLTNVLRHAGKVAVSVRVRVGRSRLELVVRNPVGAESASRTGGGSGLRGIAERVEQLGGHSRAGRDGDHWEVVVRLPCGGRGVRA